MAHIVLLGDSVFDNQVYVGSEPDVIAQLREIIPSDWQATLKAVDGSLVENVKRQFLDSPPDATHYVVSVGGNNALMNADILSLRANSSAEVFNVLADRTSDFEFHYREMLGVVLSRKLPIVVSTIYYPNFTDPALQKIAVAALSAFNDVIIRQAVLAGIPVLDLRLICCEKSDYANEIEPSSRGGRKITAKILELIKSHDFRSRKTQIFA